MARFPRLAVGTIQPGVDATAVIWALMDSLEALGQRVQSFLSRACFVPLDGATVITGLSPRHLDSWLMSEELCCEFFLRGCASSDFALVEGAFASAVRADDRLGGNLETLCGWLKLPRLAVVDVSLLSDCRLPPRPESADGLLLDRVTGPADRCRFQTLFESMWGLPVLGSLGTLPEMRRHIGHLAAGARPAREICALLGKELRQNLQLERIQRLATSQDLAPTKTPPGASADSRPLQVAVAYDEVFHSYFPDTLDLLEANGAKVSDFSLLRDERLPQGTDIVYVGCGRPDLYARELVDNHCMVSALKSHLCNGRRIYAECGGLTYLCQRLEMADGESLPMAGLLPAVARCEARPQPPKAVEITLAADNWLGPAGSQLRGYLNSFWRLEPTGPLHSYCAQKGQELDLVGRHQAIASRVYLNFAAQPLILNRFFQPHAPVAGLPVPSAPAPDG